MKRRYTFDATSGILVDRDGEPLGRVVSLTLELPVGGRGGVVGDGEEPPAQDVTAARGGGVGEPPRRPTATQLEREAVERIWAFYLEVIPSRRKLDAKRSRIIRNALHTMRAAQDCDPAHAEELVKRAVLGLSRSPHHNGQNEQRKSYLEIRYALKGIGDESDDERIEKSISWAALHATGERVVDPAKVERWLEDVRYTLSQPHRPERLRAVDSWRKLKGAGFEVEKLDKPPYARISR